MKEVYKRSSDRRISSHVRHKDRDEVWDARSPYVGLWLARMSVDYTWHTITEANEMKLDEMNEMSLEKLWNEILWQGKTGEIPRKANQATFRIPWNLHGVTETQTRDPRDVRRASNRLRHVTALFRLEQNYFLFHMYSSCAKRCLVVSLILGHLRTLGTMFHFSSVPMVEDATISLSKLFLLHRTSVANLSDFPLNLTDFVMP